MADFIQFKRRLVMCLDQVEIPWIASGERSSHRASITRTRPCSKSADYQGNNKHWWIRESQLRNFMAAKQIQTRSIILWQVSRCNNLLLRGGVNWEENFRSKKKTETVKRANSNKKTEAVHQVWKHRETVPTGSSIDCRNSAKRTTVSVKLSAHTNSVRT